MAEAEKIHLVQRSSSPTIVQTTKSAEIHGCPHNFSADTSYPGEQADHDVSAILWHPTM